MPARNKKLTISYWNSLSKGSKERALKFCYPIHPAIVKMLLEEEPTAKDIKDGFWGLVFRKIRIPHDPSHYKTVFMNSTYIP